MEKKEKYELVYFVNPTCSGKCAHCWSDSKFLGRKLNKEEHFKIIDNLNFDNIGTLKLSGGEPFENANFYEIFEYIYKKNKGKAKIIIFTSGRSLVSFSKGETHLKKTIDKLIPFSRNKVEIHMSCDEHHGKEYFERLKKKNINLSSYEELLNNMAYNFINASKFIENKFKIAVGNKLKIHCDIGRKDYHEKKLYSWIDRRDWEKMAICTEGLFKYGKNKDNPKGFKIDKNNQLSIFLIPGSKFSLSRLTGKEESYYSEDEIRKYYLGPSENNIKHPILIFGFWNLINNIYSENIELEKKILKEL